MAIRTARTTPDRAPRRDGAHRRVAARAGLPARLAILVALALAAWLSTAITIDQAQGSRLPAAALRWWPFSANARAAQAAAEATPDATPGQLAEAGRLAHGALARQLLEPAAFRALALIGARSGDAARSTAALAAGEAVSRRDLPVQLLLIELAVSKGDIDGALTHYDRALATTPSAGSYLFPVLGAAAESGPVGTRLARRLARRPSWGLPYLTWLVDDGTHPAAIAGAAAALKLHPAAEEERQLLSNALWRLVNARDYAGADALYRRARPGPAAWLRNGDFTGDNLLPPLDWQIAQTPGLGGVVEPGPSGRPVLFVDAEDGQAGEVARQLLLLPPGPAQLSALAGNVAAAVVDRSTLAVSCATDGRQLATIVPPQAGIGVQRLAATFSVPPGCPAQWLIVMGRSAGGDDARPWWGNIAVKPGPA